MNLNQVTVPAHDIAESLAFYRRLGLELIVSAPHYARFRCPEGEATFSVHVVPRPTSASSSAADGVVVYFETIELDERVRALQREGLSFVQEPRDEPWLWREARLLDPAGNVVCLYRAGANRLDPPWRIREAEANPPSDDEASDADASFEVRIDHGEVVDRHLAERVYEFNARATSYFDGESYAAVRRDASGAIVAGISGYTWGGCCHVSHLWVDEALRRRGVGCALVQAMEAHARRKGCQIVLLSSHSFQSPSFYERLGYVRQASIADHPVGHANVVLAKRLT